MIITIKISVSIFEIKGVHPYCGKCDWLNSDETGTSCDLFNEILSSSYLDDGGDSLKRCDQCLEVDKRRKA